jgi:hypothetical protein
MARRAVAPAQARDQPLGQVLCMRDVDERTECGGRAGRRAVPGARLYDCANPGARHPVSLVVRAVQVPGQTAGADKDAEG